METYLNLEEKGHSTVPSSWLSELLEGRKDSSEMNVFLLFKVQWVKMYVSWPEASEAKKES